MPATRLNMRKTRDILRLMLGKELSLRAALDVHLHHRADQRLLRALVALKQPRAHLAVAIPHVAPERVDSSGNGSWAEPGAEKFDSLESTPQPLLP